MVKRIKQSVKLLQSINEATVLNMFEHILAAPYANGVYDLPKTERLIGHCVKRGHLSILEHANITLKCVTNIGTYKDYTRHRHCAFTIESTSFSKYDEDLKVITVLDLSETEELALNATHEAYKRVGDVKIGRDFLPQCCAATMIMTTNIREWRHIISLRGDTNDNPLTRELRNMIWCVLNRDYPFFFPIETNNIENPMCLYNAWGEHKPAILP